MKFTQLSALDGINLNHRLVLPDGAQIAYSILGSVHLGGPTPIALVGGASSLAGDWERLSTVLATKRPVLVFDHRGIGRSTYSTAAKDDVITIESMARDLRELLKALRWKQIILCGFSMGGVIAQQLVLLPHHPTKPTPLPFRVTHLLLTATMVAPLREVNPANKVRKDQDNLTREQKIEAARGYVEATFDPVWVNDPKNKERLQWFFERMIVGRPAKTIYNQYRAVGTFSFGDTLKNFPRHLPILVIHGSEDLIVRQYEGEEIFKKIPWAKRLEVGNKPGQVPSEKFGHHWWEYFGVQVWVDVIEEFAKGEKEVQRAKL